MGGAAWKIKQADSARADSPTFDSVTPECEINLANHYIIVGPLILPNAAGGQKNPFQNGYLSMHTPDMQVIPRPMMQGDPAGDLSKQHLK